MHMKSVKKCIHMGTFLKSVLLRVAKFVDVAQITIFMLKIPWTILDSCQGHGL